MKKIIKLQESELINIIRDIIKEDPTLSPTLGDVVITPEEIDNIICIQSALIKAGLGNLLGKSGKNKDGVDGIYGPLTKEAVKQFQKLNGIKQTGFVGVLTAPKLGCKSMSKSKTNVVTTDKTPTDKTPTDKTTTDKTTTDKKEKVVEKIKDLYNHDVPKVSVTKEDDAYLVFNGKTLSWYSNGSIVKQWEGLSGRPVTTGNLTPAQKELVKGYDRSPEDVKKSFKDYSKTKEAGSIPQGKYSIGTIQTRSGAKASTLINSVKNIWDLYAMRSKSEKEGHGWNTGTIADRIAWGDYRIPITPQSGTNTYGRGGFYVHGGGVAGSIGCIDLTTKIDDFTKYYSTWQARTGKKSMPLTVKYS